MADDAWQTYVTREAARAVATWLEARGRLQQPIAALTLSDLEGIATVAVSRFVVLASERIRERPNDAATLRNLLMA
jgi:hypothetical protein